MDYLTAEQAAKIMSEPLPTFYRKARQGIYPNKKVKGKLQFPRQAIEAHARILQSGEDTLTFARATNADIWSRIEYNTTIYGEEDMITYQRALQWRAANSDICMSIYDAGRMVGGVTIMPVDEPIILALAHDEMREKDIPLSAIRKWSERNLSAYIPTISIIKSGKPRRDTKVAAFLLRNTIRWAISLHLQHDIKNWYAVGTTPEGQAISEALGFQVFLSLEGGERKAYKLDNLRQGSQMLKHFVERVERGDIAL